MWVRSGVVYSERKGLLDHPAHPMGHPSGHVRWVCCFFRPDANAGVDQGAGKVQSENQDPPADAGKPRRTTALEGAEEGQRIFHSL